MLARALSVLVSAALLCVSCSKDTPGSPGEGDDMHPLSVNFRMAVPSDASAADGTEYNEEWTWGDDYNQEKALSAENRILWDDFSVTFFSEKDKSYIGHLEDVHCVNLLPGVGLYTYECNGVLRTTKGMTVEALVEKLQSSGQVRTLVTANVANPRQEILDAGISDLNAGLGTMEYSCNGIFDRSFPAIPMWGVTISDFSALTPGTVISLGEVALLRSVAKVEVLISDELKEASGNKFQLKSVSINRMNKSGYVLPGMWNEIEKTKELKLSETLRIPEDAKETANSTFQPMRDDGAVVFYLPECENMAGEKEIIMTVSYTVEDEEREGEIHLCNYENGVPDTGNLWNVVRNHLYRYIITNTGEIKFKVEVHPWDKIEIPEIMM